MMTDGEVRDIWLLRKLRNRSDSGGLVSKTNIYTIPLSIREKVEES